MKPLEPLPQLRNNVQVKPPSRTRKIQCLRSWPFASSTATLCQPMSEISNSEPIIVGCPILIPPFRIACLLMFM